MSASTAPKTTKKKKKRAESGSAPTIGQQIWLVLFTAIIQGLVAAAFKLLEGYG